MSSELIVERRTPIPASPEEVFAWHTRPGAFERLVPPWQRATRDQDGEGITEGSRARLRIQVGLVSFRWIAEHRDVEPGRGFTDIQVSGPFDRWVHRHQFEAAAGGGSVLVDRIRCELPLGVRIGQSCLRRDLERLLAYRHAVTAADLAMHATAGGRPRLHVAITGASGMIGSILVPALTTGGHRVTRIVRGPPGRDEIGWDPAGNGLDPQALRGVDAVVHLAGENIAEGRWTEQRKRRLLDSRKLGTRLLALAISRAPDGPKTLVSASAIGYYGERGDERLTESSGPGTGFLPEVTTAWEEGTRPAAETGVRVVCLRIGLVLTPAGGLLQRLLLPFQFGLGGRLGSGNQWMSWISADDLVGVVHHALTHDSLRGAVNAVAPEPVTNRNFTAALGAALGRPSVLGVPASVIRLAFGEMADEAILASTRVTPSVLIETGYQFRHRALPQALRHLLGVARPG